MKKTVFVNHGKANQGKSGTIKLITNLIIQNYPNYTLIDGQPCPATGDIYAIINIGNYIIGIESLGDPNARLFKSIKKFVNYNCDIIICSSRTSGGTINAVRNLTNNSYRVFEITNYRSADINIHNNLNTYSANTIYKSIVDVINGQL